MKLKSLEQLKIGAFEGVRLSLGADHRFWRFRLSESPKETLYLLHGGNSDERQFIETGLLEMIQGDLEKTFRNRNIQIILPYIGKSFLHGAYSKFFLNELLSIAEEGSGTTNSTRWIGGLSMGGQAALNTFLREPERFGGVGAHFPTLVKFDYTSPDEVNGFAARSGITQPYLDILVGEFKNEFVDRADFFGHDPLALIAKSAAKVSKKKIYLDVGTRDEFGLGEGCVAFHEKLKELAIPHEFELVPDGKHDADFARDRFPRLLRFLFS